MSSVPDLWRRLEAYFAEHWPEKQLKLRGASEKQIRKAQTLGIRFPDDFRESLRMGMFQYFKPG